MGRAALKRARRSGRTAVAPLPSAKGALRRGLLAAACCAGGAPRTSPLFLNTLAFRLAPSVELLALLLDARGADSGTVWELYRLRASRPRHATRHCGQLVGDGGSDQARGPGEAPAGRPASLGGSASSGAVGGTQASCTRPRARVQSDRGWRRDSTEHPRVKLLSSSRKALPVEFASGRDEEWHSVGDCRLLTGRPLFVLCPCKVVLSLTEILLWLSALQQSRLGSLRPPWTRFCLWR